MDVISPGGGDDGGGRAGGGDLHHLTQEHPHAIYHNKAHYGPVSGGGTAPRSAGFKVVMVTGGNKYGGNVGDVLGGRSVLGLGGAGGRGSRVRDGDGELRQK